jgi:Icc protein
VPIGSAELDRIALQEPEQLLQPLLASPRVAGVVFGHVHQHWYGALERSSGAALPLWACPSTLAAFKAVLPCPLGHADWPGARLLLLGADGGVTTRLLRWPPARAA